MNVVQLRAASEVADPFAKDRERVKAEMKRLEIVDQKRAEAERALADVEAAIAALDEQERRSVEAWAQSGDGEPPRSSVAERKALFARRVDCQAEIASAKTAVAAVEDRRRALVEEAKRIEQATLAARVETFASDFARIAAEHESHLSEFRKLHLDAVSLPAALAEFARDNYSDHGDTATARIFLATVEKMRASTTGQVEPTDAEFKASVNRWKSAIAGRIGK